MKADDLVAEARSWLDVPYRHQGRNRFGIDCLGLLIVIARKFSITDYDEADYSRNPSGRHLKHMLSEYLTNITIPQVKPGDVLHMAAGKQPQHVAIVSGINPLRIIHADSHYGRVIEQRLDENLRAKIRGVYRIPGVVYATARD